MSEKFGAENFSLESFAQRGLHELANSLYPESNIPLRDHSGLYGSRENEPEVLDPEFDEPTLEELDLEHDGPEIDM